MAAHRPDRTPPSFRSRGSYRPPAGVQDTGRIECLLERQAQNACIAERSPDIDLTLDLERAAKHDHVPQKGWRRAETLERPLLFVHAPIEPQQSGPDGRPAGQLRLYAEPPELVEKGQDLAQAGRRPAHAHDRAWRDPGVPDQIVPAL